MADRHPSDTEVDKAPPAHDSLPGHQVRLPYLPPALERLGSWNALTLQQTIPIGPGSFLFDPDSARRFG